MRYQYSYHYYAFGSLMGGRQYNSTSYRFGFNGKEKDDEVKGVGNNIDFGARIFDSRLGRWLKIDNKESKYPGLSPYHFGYNNPITTIDPDGNENVVVVGGQFDNKSANKLMFVHQAMRQLKYYSENENDESRTLVLFTQGYSNRQVKKIESFTLKFGITLVKINSAEELKNYMNSKSTESKDLSSNRTSDLITDVDIFAHGIVGSIEFGYKQKNEAQASFDKSDAENLNCKAFTRDATITSYACRSGLGNPNINYVALPFEDLKTDESIAQALSNSTKATVKAFLTRTDYSNTLSSSQDRLFLKLYENTGMGNKSPETIKWYENFQKRLNNRENIDGAVYDPEGAVHPVVGGTSPVGLSNDIKTYRSNN